MSFSNFPNGVSSFGIPVVGSNLGLSIPTAVGKVLFVDKVNGSDGNVGTQISAPLASIGQALTNAKDLGGDTIFVYPGTYVEALTVSKDDITIVAAMRGGNSKRVAVAPASGSVPLTVGDVWRFRSIGIRFAGTSAVGVQHAGEAAYFDDCDFTSDTTHGFQFKSSTTTVDYTGSGTTIINSLFRDCGGAGLRHTSDTDTGNPNYGIQATNVNILNNQFYTNTGDDIDDDAQTGSPTYFNQWEISGNKFMTRNKAVYLDMDGGTISDCLIAGNYFADDAGLDATKIALSAGAVFTGNFQAAGVVNGSTF